MTKNYLPITEAGTARTRAVRVSLSNTYGDLPAVHWFEEDQVLMADGSYKYVPLPMPLVTMVGPDKLSKEYTVFNPDTGAELGKVSGAYILAVIQSFYITEAKERDDHQAPPLIPTPW